MNRIQFSRSAFVVLLACLCNGVILSQDKINVIDSVSAPLIYRLTEDLDSLKLGINKLESDFDEDLKVITQQMKSSLFSISESQDINVQIDTLLRKVEKTRAKLVLHNKELANKELEIRTALSQFKGECIVKFKSQRVRIYIADLNESQVDLFIKNSSKTINSNDFDGVLTYNTNAKKNVQMITNAGMYTPNFLPEGLYVDRFKSYYPVDTGSKVEANFYLKPNGVFYIDKNERAFILTTDQFLSKYKMKKPDLSLATQSGPMLVIKNNEGSSIHPAFKMGSVNKKIRSGVGVTSNGSSKVIFAISLEPMNFYDFSTMYKDWLGCESALFLDGAISEMYTSEADKDVLRNKFGPIFCVSKK